MEDMTSNDFKRRLDRMGAEISRGLVYYSVWEALWPTDDTVRIIDRLRNFVSPVRGALFETVLLRFSRVMRGDGESPGLPSMLQAAIDDPDALAPHATARELVDMSEQLEQQERALESLLRSKDQHIAQLGGNPFDDATLRKGDVENFVKSVQQIFNRLYTAHADDRYLWSPPGAALRHDNHAASGVPGNGDGSKPEGEGRGRMTL